MGPVTLVDAVVLLGVAVVLPLALGGRWWWWTGAGAALAVALLLDTGPLAAVLVAPWAAASGATLVVAVRRAGPPPCWGLDGGVAVLASAYAVVAAGALSASRLGASPFGVAEPIVALTAVHYTYAGSGALVLAGLAGAARIGAGRRPGRSRTGLAAVVVTGAAPPVVALGFLIGHPLPQIGGAVLMTVGVWLTASLQLALAARRQVDGPARALLTISGLTVWIPMVLAVAWAAGQHVDVPALSIPAMARTHGVVNALGFTVCGLAGHRLARPRHSTRRRTMVAS